MRARTGPVVAIALSFPDSTRGVATPSWVKPSRSMPRNKIITLWSGPPIRQMRQIEAEAQVQLVAKELRWGAGTERRVAECAGLALRPGDRLRQSRTGHRRMHHQDQRCLHAANERNKIIDGPAQILVGAGVDLGHGLGPNPDQRAVGGGINDHSRGNVAVRARLVLDDNRPEEALPHGHRQATRRDRPRRRPWCRR